MIRYKTSFMSRRLREFQNISKILSVRILKLKSSREKFWMTDNKKNQFKITILSDSLIYWVVILKRVHSKKLNLKHKNIKKLNNLLESKLESIRLKKKGLCTKKLPKTHQITIHIFMIAQVQKK